MKIYHTKTKKDYYALMVELEDKGAKWSGGKKPTDVEKWDNHKENTCVCSKGGTLTYAKIGFFEDVYPDVPIETYKAKPKYRDGEYFRMPKIKPSSQSPISDDDTVNSPKHYTRGDIELIDIMEDQMTPDEFMGYLKGNVTKYNYRELDKNQDEDIAKAEWYQKKLKEFVAKGKTIFSRVAKNFTKVTGYKFDDEFVKKLETGELKIVER